MRSYRPVLVSYLKIILAAMTPQSFGVVAILIAVVALV